MDKHLDHLHKVLNCLCTANFTIKMSKCQFGRDVIHYLEHVIRGGQVRSDPQKLDIVKAYPTQGEGIFGFVRILPSLFPTYISLLLLSHLLNSERAKIQMR